MQAEAGPLSGIRALDLSSYVAGPYACSLLADLGAGIIRVEPISGDGPRQYPSTLEAEPRAFLGVNRSKRGSALDLKRPVGLEALLRLARRADALVHNFRPSVPERLGISYPELHEENPRLISCAVSGYGEHGPMKDRSGYDQVLQSFTGICVFQGGGATPGPGPFAAPSAGAIHRRDFVGRGLQRRGDRGAS